MKHRPASPASLEGRVAMVTGSTRGIGAAIAERFAAFGANVVVSGRTVECGEALVEDLRDADGSARFVRCDVLEEDDVAALIEAVVAHYEGIDILVNNAAIETNTAPQEVEMKNWDTIIDTDFRAYWLTAKNAYPYLVESDHAAIVNVSSNHACLTHPRKFPYNAVKAGINGMTRAMAVDWGVDGIRVNAVVPGWTEVKRVEDELDGAEIEYLERIHPLGRIGTPEDVALATQFLASDMSRFVTGETLLVDGGRTQVIQDDILLRENDVWPGYDLFSE